MYLGSWKIDDYLPITATTHRFSSGAAYDATSITYSIYEFATDGTPTEVVTDTAMTKRDSKTGFYVDVVQLTAASGFDKGGRYVVYIAATVDSVAAITAHTFQIEAEVDANTVSPTVVAANVTQWLGTAATTPNTAGTPVVDVTRVDGTSGAATTIADGLLNRNLASVSVTNTRSPINALRFLRNKWSISAGTLTVTQEDDSTSAWTAAVTTTTGADPVTTVDPT